MLVFPRSTKIGSIMLEILLITFTLSLLFLAAIFDIRTRRIPNILSLIGLLGICFILILSKPFQEILPHLYSLIAMTLISMTIFYLHLIGGGDAKMLLVTAFSIPISDLLLLGLWISLVGGGQALFCMGLNRMYPKKSAGIPYAVAIFIGTILFFVERLFF